MPSRLDYQRDLQRLADEVGAFITLDVEDEEGATAYADVSSRSVHLYPFGGSRPDDVIYWVALHELGHIAHEHSGMGMLSFYGADLQVTEQEAEAWTWALDHAGLPLTGGGVDAILLGMSSYFHSRGVPFGSEDVARVLAAVGPNPDFERAWESGGEHPRYLPLGQASWARAWRQYQPELAAAA